MATRILLHSIQVPKLASMQHIIYLIFKHKFLV